MNSRFSLSRVDWWHGRWMFFVLTLCAFPAVLQVVALYAGSKPPAIASYIWRLASFLYGCTLPFAISALGWMRRAEFLATLPNLTRKLRQAFIGLLLATLVLGATQAMQQGNALPMLDFIAYLGLCCVCGWQFRGFIWGNVNFRDRWVWIGGAAGLLPLLIVLSHDHFSLQTRNPGVQALSLLLACAAIMWRWHSLRGLVRVPDLALRWARWLINNELLSTSLPVAILAVASAVTNSHYFILMMMQALALHRLRREQLLAPLRLRWFAGVPRARLFYVALRTAGGKMLSDLSLMLAVFTLAASLGYLTWSNVLAQLWLPFVIYLFTLRVQFGRICDDQTAAEPSDLSSLIVKWLGVFFAVALLLAGMLKAASNQLPGDLDMGQILVWIMLLFALCCVLELFIRQRRHWSRLAL
ncbi:hypothetical protein [Uliginosibacterium sediminicola]|uniref:Uncharacterized protein n=1 Tax=Uliginosibacterium sediminicola TaxID=2024550 RepID=A0ABU9YZE3_9RHOO